MGQDGSDASSYIDEVPVHSVDVPGFQISKYEITNQQYAVFLNSARKEMDTVGNRFYDFDDAQARILRVPGGYAVRSGWESHPVTEVSWYGANAFCEWVDGRLSTEAEWEKAARWDAWSQRSRKWPWGDTFECWRNSSWWCNDPHGTRPVGSYPGGISYYGLYETAGNVWEWTVGGYRSYPGNAQLAFADPTREVQRGGSWTNSDYNLRCASRSPQPRYMTDANLGFRVVWSAVSPDPIPVPNPNVRPPRTWTEDFAQPVSMVETKKWWGDAAEWYVDPANGWLVARMYRDEEPLFPAGEFMAMFRRYLSSMFSPGDVVDITVRLRYERGDRGFARTSVAFAWGDTRWIDPGGRGADENTGYPWFLLANNSDTPGEWHEVTCPRVTWGEGAFCLGFGLWGNMSDQADPPITPHHRMFVDWIRVRHSAATGEPSLRTR